MSTTLDIAEIIAQTDASKAPVRLEYVRGRTKWEASPASRHQKALQRIERSLRPILGHAGGCGCFALADTLIRFGDPDRSMTLRVGAKRHQAARPGDLLRGAARHRRSP